VRWCVDGTYFHTWCGLSANLRCRSETCCTRLAGNTGRKKVARYATFGHHCTTLLGYIFATKARSQNMVYFGLLAAEICWRVWGTPAHFNGFRVLAALLHSTLVVGVSQTTALNKGRHLYSAERTSRWALAHISRIQQSVNRQPAVLLGADRVGQSERRILPVVDHCTHLLFTHSQPQRAKR